MDFDEEKSAPYGVPFLGCAQSHPVVGIDTTRLIWFLHTESSSRSPCAHPQRIRLKCVGARNRVLTTTSRTRRSYWSRQSICTCNSIRAYSSTHTSSSAHTCNHNHTSIWSRGSTRFTYYHTPERESGGEAPDGGDQPWDLGRLDAGPGEEVLPRGLGAVRDGPVLIPCAEGGELS
jgi:hypothetical protein